MYTNDLMLRALKGEKLQRPPVWMMRQAGRYLPDYMKLKEKHSFFERIENPELATEITVMPVDQIGVDAAILFSDILVVPQALGMEVQMISGKGPVLPNPVSSISQAQTLPKPDVEEKLHYVMDAIKLTVKTLDKKVPLIGFVGSPWTLFCYMVEGHGSKDFSKAKAFCYQHPSAAKKLLQSITGVCIDFLNAQIKAGVAVVQIFDSWGGLLGPEDYKTYSLPYIDQIVKGVKGAPSIVFAKGCWFALKELAATGTDGLGLDWTINPKWARAQVGDNITLQGNFDPSKLLGQSKDIQKECMLMIDNFGTQNYIANLGHGILPDVPVHNAKAFVDSVKNYQV
ncbi:MAG: uroporphyrinogen decarboxylase [Chitinophagales bacterium]